MSRVCIVIGEGESERYFIPSMLENKLGFTSLTDKGVSSLFQKGEELFWFLPFPPSSTSPEGGKARLIKTKTYRTANAIIRNQAYLCGENPEIYYRILVDHNHGDIEGQKKKCEDIGKAFVDSGVTHAGYRVDVVENELECWYFAGMTENFPYLERGKASDLQLLLNSEPERISDPKGHLRRILAAETHGAIKMAEIMGKHIDMVQAREKSASFNTFITNLESDGLI